MELQFASFPVFFTFLIFLLMIIIERKRSKSKSKAPKLPPGPSKLPLIGNMHQLADPLPHHTLRTLAKKHGPLLHIQVGEVSTIVVSSSEIAKEIMKTHDIIFADRPYLLASKIMNYDSTNIGFARYGEYWRQLKKICVLELLSVKRVQSFRSVREDEVSNLIKTISLNGRVPINLSEKIFSLTYGVVSRVAFGKKFKEQKAFVHIVDKALKLAGGFCLADMYPSVKFLPRITGMKSKLEKMHHEVDRMLQNIINDHKQSKETGETGEGEAKEDLVDVLLNLQEHGDLEFPLKDSNIKAVLLDMFGAGGDTSSTVIEWAMSEMLKNPRVMKKAQDEVRKVFNGKENVDESSLHELNYLKSVIKETLRFHPPVPLLVPRECREDCEINGYDIPAKTKVIVNAWAIGRDPEYWNEAEIFYPERFLDSPVDYKGAHFEFIPFGAGRRMCPGISFALANIELPLAQFLYHFDWELPDGMKEYDLDMAETFGMTVRRKNDLYLIPIPYKP